MIDELIQLSRHAEVAQKEGVQIEVFKKTKLALLYREFVFVFEKLLRVYHPLASGFLVQGQSSQRDLTFRRKAPVNIGSVKVLQLGLRPLKGGELQIINASRMDYLNVVFLRLSLRLLENRFRVGSSEPK